MARAPEVKSTGPFMVSSSAASDWHALLERLPPDRRDVYLTPEYAAPFERCYGDRAELFVHQDGDAVIVVPLLRRRLPAEVARVLPEHSDLATPYGYGGPIASTPSPDPSTWVAMLATFREYCAQTHVLTEFERLHPMISTPGAYAGAPGLRQRGVTFALDISRSPDDVERGFRKGHRQSAARARAAGLRIRATGAPTDVAAFHRLYLATMEHAAAAKRYWVPEAFFAETLTALASNAWLLIAEAEREIVAGALFLRHGARLHYHFAATARTPASTGASVLLIAEAIRLGHAAGCTSLHLGGGGTSLAGFKRGFGGQVLPFWTYEEVHDAQAYAQVCPAGAMVPCYREDADTL